MRYFFPIHLDGGNRGCEGIAKGSAILLGEDAGNLFGYCRDVALDRRLGVDRFCTLVPYRRSCFLVDKFLGAVNRLFGTNRTLEWRLLSVYRSFLRQIGRDDVLVSTGGDMMCYDNNEVICTNNWARRRGIRTVLWGCSMGPENATPEKLDTLRRFSLVYARESLSYDYFRSLGLERVCLLPDPAFVLPAEECELPRMLDGGRVVGLNVSSYVVGGMSLDGPFGCEVLRLISHILVDTDYRILLVPHVTWHDALVNQDDREMARLIFERAGAPERIGILDIDGLNYCQIRYVISRCSMFIGARTHAVISAYSMCVPTIALGYSVKSRGIARDLGLSESLVVDCKRTAEGDLVRAFDYLAEHAGAIGRHLSDIMPAYRERAYEIREFIKKL